MQALLTMTKCDVACASDAASVMAGCSPGAPATDCIIHAGGVLKVELLFWVLST